MDIKEAIKNRRTIRRFKQDPIPSEILKKLINYYKKGMIKKVLIKVGIPFVPSFLVAYIITLFFGNVLMVFV